MSYLPNFYIQICSSIQISNCFLDTWPLSWYPLIHTNHFTVINRCPAATPNHFAAIHLRQNPLVPCGAAFFILTREFAAGRPACNSSYPNLENCMSRLDLDTAPRPRRNAGEPDNAAATQGQERRFGASGDHANRRHFYLHPHSQLWKPRSSLKSVFLFWTEKAISKYRPVATISKIEIASH